MLGVKFVNHTGVLLDLAKDCEEAVTQLMTLLVERGLQVRRSFDLQVARAAHTGCSCPHHGTSQCNCQMIVLLVYGQGANPATLVVHGRDGQTQVSLVNTPDLRPDDTLEAEIRETLGAQSISHLGVYPHAT